MYRSSKNLVLSRAMLDNILSAIGIAGAADELLNLAVVKLFKNDVQPTINTLVEDFEICDFTGYATPASPTWIGPGNASADSKSIHVEQNYTAGAIDPGGQNAYGYYITNAGGTVLLASERFEVPVNFAVEDDFLSLDVIWELASIWPTSQ